MKNGSGEHSVKPSNKNSLYRKCFVAFVLISIIGNTLLFGYYVTPRIYAMFIIQKYELLRDLQTQNMTLNSIKFNDYNIFNRATKTRADRLGKTNDKLNLSKAKSATKQNGDVLTVTEMIATTQHHTERTKITKSASTRTTLPTTPTNKKKQIASLCPNIHSLHEQEETLYNGMACKPRAPPIEACDYTAEKFKLRPSILTCKDKDEIQHSYALCGEPNMVVQSTDIEITCDISVCDKNKDILIEELDESTGQLRKKRVDENVRGSNEKFGKLVAGTLLRARNKNLNFVFLNCTKKGEKSSISQMISVLPKLQHVESSERKLHGGKLNVNILLLDSISRAHFYRSFPKTLQYLREKQHSKIPKTASFFEFEFFQAINGHTHENENAFFSGSLYPANYSKKQIARSPTNPQILYGAFKEAGYQTLYLEDLCWRGRYGIMDSLKASNWNILEERVGASNIDSTGITHSSCKILNMYGSNVQFFAKKRHQVCFNGRHHHEYLLKYIASYIKTVQSTPKSKPLFTYTALNVAHDDAGLRVQTLDKHLMEFIDTMSRQEDTVTFVFADHGNTYTYYQVKMLEGRLEMYHPMMLGIIPYKVGEKLGSEVLVNLRTNQQRLFNLFDLRAGLVGISKYDGSSKFKPTGLFDGISKDRVCNDLVLTKASICICDGWYVPVKNDTMQLLIAEFAIGQLNNKIQDQLLKSRNDEPQHKRSYFLFGHCQRLHIQKFTNMRQRVTEQGRISATMDINVQSGNLIKQDEVFTVNVEYKKESSSLEMKLISFERVSTYGIYEQCADPHVELQLCVCNKRESFNAQKTGESAVSDLKLNKSHPIYDIIGRSAEISNLNKCVLLIHRLQYGKKSQKKWPELKVYGMANICDGRNITVHADALEAKNVFSSVELPLSVILQSRTLYFIIVLKAEDHLLEPKLNLHIRIVN